MNDGHIYSQFMKGGPQKGGGGAAHKKTKKTSSTWRKKVTKRPPHREKGPHKKVAKRPHIKIIFLKSYNILQKFSLSHNDSHTQYKITVTIIRPAPHHFRFKTIWICYLSNMG